MMKEHKKDSFEEMTRNAMGQEGSKPDASVWVAVENYLDRRKDQKSRSNRGTAFMVLFAFLFGLYLGIQTSIEQPSLKKLLQQSESSPVYGSKTSLQASEQWTIQPEEKQTPGSVKPQAKSIIQERNPVEADGSAQEKLLASRGRNIPFEQSKQQLESGAGSGNSMVDSKETQPLDWAIPSRTSRTNTFSLLPATDEATSDRKSVQSRTQLEGSRDNLLNAKENRQQSNVSTILEPGARSIEPITKLNLQPIQHLNSRLADQQFTKRSIDNEAILIPKPKQRPWKVGLSIGAAEMHRLLISKDGDQDRSVLADYYNHSEKAVLSQNGGIDLSFTFSNHMSIETGLQINYYQWDNLYSSLVRHQNEGELLASLHSTATTNKIGFQYAGLQNWEQGEVYELTVKGREYLQYVSVPLIFRVDFAGPKWGFFGKSGMTISRLQDSGVRVLDASDKIRNIRTVEKGEIQNNLITGEFALGLTYKVGRLQFELSPHYTRGLSSNVKLPSYDLRLEAVGLKTGLYARF